LPVELGLSSPDVIGGGHPVYLARF
jgi:hypothetical protein